MFIVFEVVHILCTFFFTYVHSFMYSFFYDTHFMILTQFIILKNTWHNFRPILLNYSYTPTKLLEPTPLDELISLRIVLLVSNRVVYMKLLEAHYCEMHTWTLRVSVWTVR